MNLYYEDQFRTEDDPDDAATLIRKGWQECPPQPVYDPKLQSCTWDWHIENWVVTNYTPEQIAQMRAAEFPDATPRQIRIWLVLQGTDPDTIPGIIVGLISDPTQQQIALISWEFSIGIARDNPLTIAVSNALGYTQAQMDAYWPDILKI